jgi:hypothetical protein
MVSTDITVALVLSVVFVCTLLAWVVRDAWKSRLMSEGQRAGTTGQVTPPLYWVYPYLDCKAPIFCRLAGSFQRIRTAGFAQLCI